MQYKFDTLEERNRVFDLLRFIGKYIVDDYYENYACIERTIDISFTKNMQGVIKGDSAELKEQFLYSYDTIDEKEKVVRLLCDIQCEIRENYIVNYFVMCPDSTIIVWLFRKGLKKSEQEENKNMDCEQEQDLLRNEITALYQYVNRDSYSLDVIHSMILQLKDMVEKKQKENKAFVDRLEVEDGQVPKPIQPFIFTERELEKDLDKMELSGQNTDLRNENAALITAITLLKEKLSAAQETNTDLLKRQYRLNNKIAELKQKIGE